MDSNYLLLLRLLHICFGVFWAGTAIYLSFFISPAVKALGPDGPRFMQQIVKTNQFPVVIVLSAIITVVSGVLLIWKLSGGLQSHWLGTSYGQVLTAGGICAILAFLVGFFVNRPASFRIAKIGKDIVVSGTEPSAAQVAELQRLGKKISTASRFIAFLLMLAVIGMSIFRYV